MCLEKSHNSYDIHQVITNRKHVQHLLHVTARLTNGQRVISASDISIANRSRGWLNVLSV